ncbi:hypothetical protein [Nocardia cyriacigeorgica]|uniref:hypothetical protein n=1 Tax=Nocardia cyriacigeorgica TaxID=135487 RepID=UPI000CE9DA3F|nr:hypothetical protein [Nocardia cyriacigeorgica]MBF6321989.1 hypothetical protein [Nocardia cyriacigeorgica]MBF6497715.1 hypothetical protein [Nocardia cyriacigeorgica]PPJ10924.1 hypothetical protein C5E43_12780 [Nocardia cyriacigeorgica]
MTAAVDDQTGKPAPSRSRLPRPVYAALGALIMLALVVDAVITLILEVLYLPLYLGSVAFPIAAPLAGVINVALVLGARTVSPRPIVMLIPIVAWTLSFLAAASSGPGGDVPLGSDARTLLLMLFGLAPPLIYVYLQANRTKVAQPTARR